MTVEHRFGPRYQYKPPEALSYDGYCSVEVNLNGKIVNSDFFGFTEYRGPEKWEKTPEEGQIGRPYNLFICNRCKEFMFWSRIYGEFPIIDVINGIDPYCEAEAIAKVHHIHCHVEGELNSTYKKENPK